MANLLPLLPKLNEKDLHNIAFAMRRKGDLTGLPHFGHVTIEDIAWFKCEVIIAALHEAAATYPAVIDTISKLQRKKR
jgi:hypothetical protein